MTRPPFENGPREEVQFRPLPCPECESTRGYKRVGEFRCQCLNCNSLIKNEEVNMEPSNEEQR